MPSKNLPIRLPPGVVSDLTDYAAKGRWHDGNLIRWTEEGAMVPVGGWVEDDVFTGATGPIRSTFSWRANNFEAWAVVGSEDKAFAFSPGFTTAAIDITPVDLVWAASSAEGYGSDLYGKWRYGLDSTNASGMSDKFREGFWTFDNFGESLVAVHSIDGRLFEWDHETPNDPMVENVNAPIGNYIVITTNERHVMLMGGDGNPRRVKWCSREDINDWTASPTNSAGGFDLDTKGIILAAARVPQGILVMTDIDVHLIEYVGPNGGYYSRRLISPETGIIGPKAFTATPNGVMFMGTHSFWIFNSGLTRVPCSISDRVFRDSTLSKPLRIFMGNNYAAREVWTFYPCQGGSEPDRLAIFRYADNDDTSWWSPGVLTRTAWLSAIWSEKPYTINDDTIYQHEIGWTDDGAARDIWAKTGAIEISDGDAAMLIDRIYHDAEVIDDIAGTIHRPNPAPYTLEFEQAQAPQGSMWTTGPLTLNADIGFTTTRFKSRQVRMKVKEATATNWVMGEVRLRVKAMGAR